ncbi:MAG: hypothetical protein WDN75_17090 [Bacteroidota bacterium]
MSAKPATQETSSVSKADSTNQQPVPISDPLVTEIYTADPSAHLFDGKIYIYPSHDIEAGAKENDMGDHFDMRDYHIFRWTASEERQRITEWRWT